MQRQNESFGYPVNFCWNLPASKSVQSSSTQVSETLGLIASSVVSLALSISSARLPTFAPKIHRSSLLWWISSRSTIRSQSPPLQKADFKACGYSSMWEREWTKEAKKLVRPSEG